MRKTLFAAGLCAVALSVGGTLVVSNAAAQQPPLPGRLRQIKVLADKAPDCSSLKSIVESVTRGCETNDEKAIALYNFMQLSHYHQNYPSERGGLGALKEINVYGWSLCGGLHTIQAALWREMGWPWRFVGWSDPGHTTAECQYDGKWHYLDVFLRYYAWMPDAKAPGGRTIAGEDDLKANPKGLVTEALIFDKARQIYYRADNPLQIAGGKSNWLAPSFLSCGDEPGGILTGLKSSSRAGSPTEWAALKFDSPGYSTDVNLAPGMSLSLNWDGIPGAHWWNGRKYVPGHGCGDRDSRNCPAIGPILEPYNRTGGQRRSFANGILTYAPKVGELTSLQSLAAHENVALGDGKWAPADPSRPASVTIEMQSPYIITQATGHVDGDAKAEVSIDGGKTFKAVELKDFSETVGGNLSCWIRLTFKTAIRSLKFEAVVQCNRGSLPYLSPGKNKITVDAADAKDLGDGQLVVTYAFQTGARHKSYEQIIDSGAEIARAHYATWATKPTVVQRFFTAKDLPATFDIDLPTPKGKSPVYPRMLFVRREVVPAGMNPMPLPDGAEILAPARPDELLALPNPFTVGTSARKQ